MEDMMASCEKVANLGLCTGQHSDYISSLGERWSTAIMTKYLRKLDVPSAYVLASDILVTDSVAGGATPDLELTKQATIERLVPLLQEGILPCITGFIGADQSKTITTLGRGGSDLSASVIGAVLDADEVTMYKVESVAAEDGTLGLLIALVFLAGGCCIMCSFPLRKPFVGCVRRTGNVSSLL